MLIAVMRHGDAEAYAGESGDPARALTAQGHKENRQVAEQLQQLMRRQSRDFQRIWVSPYRRAQQTATDVLEYLSDQLAEQHECLVPEASPHNLLGQLERQCMSADDAILMIGHNPLVSRFVALVTDGGPTVERYLDTSHLVVVETEVVAPACGVLKYYLTP